MQNKKYGEYGGQYVAESLSDECISRIRDSI